MALAAAAGFPVQRLHLPPAALTSLLLLHTCKSSLYIRHITSVYTTFTDGGPPLEPHRRACTVTVRYKYVYRYPPTVGNRSHLLVVFQAGKTEIGNRDMEEKGIVARDCPPEPRCRGTTGQLLAVAIYITY